METNESQNSDNRIELTDLALSEDQQGEVKGGPGVITLGTGQKPNNLIPDNDIEVFKVCH